MRLIASGIIPGANLHLDSNLSNSFKSSSVRERALYLNEQLQLPEDERVLSIEELDAGQVMHKPGKL